MEASIEMARKLVLGRESGHGVNAGAGARYQAARIVSPPRVRRAAVQSAVGVLAPSCRPGCHRRCRRH